MHAGNKNGSFLAQLPPVRARQRRKGVRTCQLSLHPRQYVFFFFIIIIINFLPSWFFTKFLLLSFYPVSSPFSCFLILFGSFHIFLLPHLHSSLFIFPCSLRLSLPLQFLSVIFLSSFFLFLIFSSRSFSSSLVDFGISPFLLSVSSLHLSLLFLSFLFPFGCSRYLFFLAFYFLSIFLIFPCSLPLSPTL